MNLQRKNRHNKTEKSGLKTKILLFFFSFALILFVFKNPLFAEAKEEDQSKSSLTHIYDPSDMEKAKKEYDYVCHYVDALKEEHYLFFNVEEERMNQTSSLYMIDDDLHLFVNNGVLSIKKVKDKGFFRKTFTSDIYTDFAIHKIDKDVPNE